MIVVWLCQMLNDLNKRWKSGLWLFNQEIEERIAQYRDDNWQKEQSMTEEVDTSMEE